MLEHFFQSVSKSLKFNPGQISSPPSRANSRAKEAFIGIDVSHTSKQGLIQQCSFDRQFSSMKKVREFVPFDRERLCSPPIEPISSRQVPKLEASETSRIDKTQLASALQPQPRMRMLRHCDIRGCNQKTSSHSEVNDPLRRNHTGFPWRAVIGLRSQLHHDVLPGTVHRFDPPLN